jgi:hypothetical protein
MPRHRDHSKRCPSMTKSAEVMKGVEGNTAIIRIGFQPARQQRPAYAAFLPTVLDLA